jgi:hypothetical protein
MVLIIRTITQTMVLLQSSEWFPADVTQGTGYVKGNREWLSKLIKKRRPVPSMRNIGPAPLNPRNGFLEL